MAHPSAKRVASRHMMRRGMWLPDGNLRDEAKDPGRHDPIPKPEIEGSALPGISEETDANTETVDP